jgi:PhnB protein
MNNQGVLPPGYQSLIPRMVVPDVLAEVAFLQVVFGATGDVHADRPAEIRIGNSTLLISRAGERELFPAFLYVYVDDADSAYQRAVGAGAISVEPPRDTPYGDRRAMVRDISGNTFQIAHRCATDTPNPATFGLTPIGWVESPLTDRSSAPHQADEGAPEAWLFFAPSVVEGLLGLHTVEIIAIDAGRVRVRHLEVLNNSQFST